jgi:hypothetical protein
VIQLRALLVKILNICIKISALVHAHLDLLELVPAQIMFAKNVPQTVFNAHMIKTTDK